MDFNNLNGFSLEFSRSLQERVTKKCCLLLLEETIRDIFFCFFITFFASD